MSFDIIIIPFLNVLVFIYDFIGHNFGLAIIIFTVLVRLATYPFTKSQLESSKKMQELQSNPEWQKIQKKHKDDKEKLSQEQMRLYQEMGINPLGSCLPTLLQFPLIIALYSAVTRAMAASPLQLMQLIHDLTLNNKADLLPLNGTFLWMDLSQPERWFLPESLPVIGGFGVPILAILVFITSFLQSKMMGSSTATNDQQAQQMKMMTMYMPLLMAWFSYQYAAGLALYFVSSNIVSILQYAMMGRLDFKKLMPGSK